MSDDQNKRNNNFNNNINNNYRKAIIYSAKANNRMNILREENNKQLRKKNEVRNNYNTNYNNKDRNIRQVKNDNSRISNSTNKSNYNQVKNSFENSQNKRINTMPNENNEKINSFYNNNTKAVVDICSHVALKGNNNDILNRFRDVNKDPRILKQNLRNINENSDIILQMDNVLNRVKQRKNFPSKNNTINTNYNSINYNSQNEDIFNVGNKITGYYSDGYVKDQKKINIS